MHLIVHMLGEIDKGGGGGGRSELRGRKDRGRVRGRGRDRGRVRERRCSHIQTPTCNILSYNCTYMYTCMYTIHVMNALRVDSST